MVPLTQEEIEARAKGYHGVFRDYKEPNPGETFILPASEREKLETWCRPFLDAGIEIAGGFVFSVKTVDGVDRAVIEKVYCYGGKSKFLRTTVAIDPDNLLQQIQRDYQEIDAFYSNRVGYWHLHPFYAESALSVGDVTEIRKGFEEAGIQPGQDVGSFQILLTGSRGGFDVTGYTVSPEAVYRFPVVAP